MNRDSVFSAKNLPAAFTYTAHTGCMDTADNSLASIDEGVKYGAKIVEFDLYFTKDNLPVLSHNEPQGGEPTLDEAFRKLVEYPCLLANVDVKVCTPQIAQVYPLAVKHGIADRIFFTGLFEADIPTVQAVCPEVPYWLNIDVLPKEEHTEQYLQSLVGTVRNCGAVGINMNKTNATKELVDLFHANGLGVSLWTASTQDEIQFALSLYPDNITTRRPDLMQKELQ